MSMDTRLMEAKKVEPTTPAPTAKDSPQKNGVNVLGFIGEVKEEFHKISWTTPEELKLHTKMVVGATFLFGMGIYFADLCIQSVLHLIGTVFHFIFG